MTFEELAVGQKFQAIRWDGTFDSSGPIYTKIAPMKYKSSDKVECNAIYKDGRQYWVSFKPSDLIVIATVTKG